MSRGLREGDLVHCKSSIGEFDYNEIYEVVDVELRPRDFEWVAKVVIRRPDIHQSFARPFTFKFENVKKVSPLIALALQAEDDAGD